MKTTLRRILGILVMIAGVLGLVLSIAGLFATWMIKPKVAQGLENTVTMLSTTIESSKQAMTITAKALGGTVSSIDALQTMLQSTATSLQDTKPMVSSLTGFLGDQLPKTMTAASDSLKTAQSAAGVLDNAIKSLNNFSNTISNVPFLSGLIQVPKLDYNPDKPLANSLGEIATEVNNLPTMFTDMSQNLTKATSNLDTIQTSLTTMAGNVSSISASLNEYKTMVAKSQSSLDNLQTLLANFQARLNYILNIAAIVVTLFLLWLMAAQVVIFSQGWELYQGTTDRIES